MKTDYPELEGKEVVYDNTEKEVKAVVSGCNYHVGISIENSDGYLLCLNGKSSPLYKNIKEHLPRCTYRKVFHLLVKQIKEGKIKPAILVNMTSPSCNQTPTENDCPFAQ